MAQLRQSQTESELRQLRAQIDSHFLFNNLNVLRGLIQHDPAEAHAYLNRFANLYRFLIRHKDDDFVTLAEELQFVYEYVCLLRHRFGAAYGFRQELPAAAELHRLLVVPGTVQLLVENSIKHNAGDDDDPRGRRWGPQRGSPVPAQAPRGRGLAGHGVGQPARAVLAAGRPGNRSDGHRRHLCRGRAAGGAGSGAPKPVVR